MPIDQQFSGDFEERIVSSRTLGNEEEAEYSLRPKKMSEYI